MCFNDYPRACALGFEEVSPFQGFSLSIDVNTMILRCIIVGFLGGIAFSSLGALSEWGVKMGMEWI